METTFNFFDNSRFPARISISTREITFDIKAVFELARLQDMTFNETFAMCMSHELIHEILYDFVSIYAYDTFDNICYRKYKEMKHWIGGIGGK